MAAGPVDEDRPGGRRQGQTTLRQSHADIEPHPATPALVVFLATISAIGGFLFGYDTSVISGAMLLLKERFDLSTFKQELVVSVTVAGAFVGSLAAGVLGSRFGRRQPIVVGSVLFCAGSACLAASPTWGVLTLGRAIVGVGVGLASAAVPVYVSECAPAHLRGMLSVVNIVCVTSGQCISNIVNAAFSTVPEGWCYMFGVAALPALVQLVGFAFLPESPRFLAAAGREDEAKKVLQRLRGPTADISKELSDIFTAARLPQRGVGALFSSSILRRILVLACMLQAINQLVGINTLMYYNATILQLAGIVSNTMAMWIAAGINAVFAVFTVAGLLLVERAGRRQLMLISLVGVTISCLLIAQAFWLADVYSPAVEASAQPIASHYVDACSNHTRCTTCLSDHACGFCFNSTTFSGACLQRNQSQLCAADAWYADTTTHTHSSSNATEPYAAVCPDQYSWLAIVALCMYLSFFGLGVTSMPWVINAEIFPTDVRGAGNSLATSVNWVCNMAVSLSFLTLTETITKPGTFWLYGGISVLSFVYLLLYLPETKGKTLEEIESLFRLPGLIGIRRTRDSDANDVSEKQALLANDGLDDHVGDAPAVKLGGNIQRHARGDD